MKIVIPPSGPSTSPRTQMSSPSALPRSFLASLFPDLLSVSLSTLPPLCSAARLVEDLPQRSPRGPSLGSMDVGRDQQIAEGGARPPEQEARDCGAGESNQELQDALEAAGSGSGIIVDRLPNAVQEHHETVDTDLFQSPQPVAVDGPTVREQHDPKAKGLRGFQKLQGIRSGEGFASTNRHLA